MYCRGKKNAPLNNNEIKQYNVNVLLCAMALLYIFAYFFDKLSYAYIHLSIYLSVCSSLYLSIYITTIYPSIILSIIPCICTSIHHS